VSFGGTVDGQATYAVRLYIAVDDVVGLNKSTGNQIGGCIVATSTFTVRQLITKILARWFYFIGMYVR